MPRPAGGDPTNPLPLCPHCRQPLKVHNTRTESNAKGQYERVEIYLCILHGFFRVSESQPLTSGM